VSQDKLQIGRIITGLQQRDAIHIAVLPVTAGEDLYCGHDVRLLSDGTAVQCEPEHRLGVVDPFLMSDEREHRHHGVVEKGQRFWLFLNPGTITTLRHEWVHPGVPDGDQDAVAAKDVRKIAETWLRDYAIRVKPYEDAASAYENLMNDLRHKRLFYHGHDMHSRSDVIDEEELIKHAQIVLGIELNFGDEDFEFSCSC